MVAPSKVVAMALNTSLYRTDDEACSDRPDSRRDRAADRRPGPLGADRLWPAVRDAVDALSWA